MKRLIFVMVTFACVVALAGSVSACPASYVTQMAEGNKGTALYDKSAQVADKYMTNRGIDPESEVGEITRPYVIGTVIVEHNMYPEPLRSLLGAYFVAKDRIDLNKDSVDGAVQKALGTYAGSAGTANSDLEGHTHFDENGLLAPCSDHFNRHFGNGIFQGGMSNPLNSNSLGG